MALSRNRRDSHMMWPGFVDAVTVLLMVMMFILTVFTVMQSVLRDQITTQGSEIAEQNTELAALNEQVAALSSALGLEQRRAEGLEGEVGELEASLSTALAEGTRQEGVIAGLQGDLAAREADLTAARSAITSYEAQVAALIGERDKALGDLAIVTGERDSTRADLATVNERAEGLAASVAELEAAKARLITEEEALQLALAKLRDEVSAGDEEARLAAARADALEALVRDLRAKGLSDSADLASAEIALTEAEKTRLADAAALEALRKKLEGADAELTAMTLALEEQRKKAEETLTLLAAARAAEAEGQMTVSDREAALAAATAELSAEQAKSLEAARQVELLNQQIAALREQLGSLQGILDSSEAGREAAEIQLDSLGRDLNAALAQVAAEQKRRAELEEAERVRLEAENADLERFRSEFFGQLSQLLTGREGVRVVGDRFVFSSEVLFTAGSADLSNEGKTQIASVVQILNEIRAEIPQGIDWIIRVDGHTDNRPLSGTGAFADNWELSQARALSVVRYMQDQLGFPPDRLAATGFGEYRPVAPGDDEASRAMNRRIELKLTER